MLQFSEESAVKQPRIVIPDDAPPVMGAIRRRFAELGRAIGMRLIAWTMHPNPALGFDLVPLDQLYGESDVISLHLRLSEETRGMVGEREFALMKDSSILINTARGPIVD